MLPLIFIMPIVQLLLLVYAATLDMKNINMAVVDQDLSGTSRRMAGKFEGSPFYKVHKNYLSIKSAERALVSDKADIILHIPAGFERQLMRDNKAEVQMIVNAINGTVASLSNVYTTSIINDFNLNIITSWFAMPQTMVSAPVQVLPIYWYNAELNYKHYMLPGILVILVTMIGAFLTALNIVREKEMGTIEQINVTPIRKYQFLAGKLIPFWCIAMFEMAFGLTLGKLIFDIPMVGSIPLLFLFTAVYLIVVLGIGLVFSILAHTQQQVMFFAYFFMLTFILMSGIFTPVETMPNWAQKVNIINPFMYFMKAIRMILLKGSGFWDIFPQLSSLLAYGVIINGIAVLKYRKVQ
jgi:ABC-2 type transport system permease protein